MIGLVYIIDGIQLYHTTQLIVYSSHYDAQSVTLTHAFVTQCRTYIFASARVVPAAQPCAAMCEQVLFL